MCPFSHGNWQDEFVVEGQEPGPHDIIPVASIRSVTPGYFETMEIILQGRSFQRADTESAPRVAIVDETLARRYWPKGEALGRHIRHGGAPSKNPSMMIVGIVRSVKNASLDESSGYYYKLTV